jgi:hypothetical protein
MSRGLVAGPAPQVVAEVLEQHRVEAEETAHLHAAERLLRVAVDGMAPSLGHALRVLGEVAPGAVRRRQDEARRPVRSDHPTPHGAEPRTVM